MFAFSLWCQGSVYHQSCIFRNVSPSCLNEMVPQSLILKLQCYFHVLLRDQRHLLICKYQERCGEVRIHKWGVHVCSCSKSMTLHWSYVTVSWDVKRYSHFSSAASGTAEGRKHLDLREEQTPEHKRQVLCCSKQPSRFPHSPALCPVTPCTFCGQRAAAAWQCRVWALLLFKQRTFQEVFLMELRIRE